MNIKTFIAAAAALTLTACTGESEDILVPADEAEAAQIELNDDGTVKSEVPVNHLELDSDKISPQEVSEDNPTGP